MFDRDVYDLSQIGLINQVSSLRRVGGQRPPNFAFKPPAPGESAVFYPTPRNRRGEYVRACGFRGDDDRRCAQEESVRFCREMGHRDAAFSQTRGGYLIDVLCVR